MMALSSDELQDLAEGHDLEIKRATGRDGRGELPRSFFESYAAMANTEGGVILLGIEERPRGRFIIFGITEPERVLTALWSGLSDRHQVSANLLTNQMVTIVEERGHQIIRIQIPRANRSQRPVFVGKNPLGGTYRRNFDGDYRCDDEAVKRMLVEQVEDVRDSRILEGYAFEDIDPATFRTYRNQFRSSRPEHPWHDEDDQELLRLLGGWRRDRQSGREGLTLAGVLMFGRLASILEAVPHYVVDYQERLSDSGEIRWVDRITTDGTWSGNLYDFYRRTIQRLFEDLKVPFRLDGDMRVDETPVHVALREALVNTLIHADFTGRPSILVVKRPGLFGFRNPGTMRLSLSEAINGGLSDCRNRNLQKMFQLVGLGEQAGSGIPRILNGWHRQHWRFPVFSESSGPDQTSLSLLPISLFPPVVMDALDRRFGREFQSFSEAQRLALATVMIEGKVTHARLRGLSSDHPHDLTKALSSLVRAGHLESNGVSRSTVYFFPGDQTTGERSIGQPVFAFSERGEQLGLLYEHDDQNQHGAGDELETRPTVDQRAEGEVSGGEAEPAQATADPSREADQPAQATADPSREADQPAQATTQSQQEPMNRSSGEHGLDIEPLLRIATPVRERETAPSELVESIILTVCTNQFLTSRQLAFVLNRHPRTLSNHYLGRMVKEGRLVARYPMNPSHPNQAYTTRLPMDNGSH